MSTIYLHALGRRGLPVSGTALGTTIAIEAYADAADPVFLLGKGGELNIYGMELTDLSAGRAVARSDGGTSVFLHDVHGPSTVTAKGPEGQDVTISVAAMIARDGWAEADYYKLETDPVTGDLIVEPGVNHKVIYTSQSGAALDEIGIAAMHNLANGTSLTASSITAAWLIANPEYGATSDKAVKWTVATKIINGYPKTAKVYPSFWMHFERGHDYGLWPKTIHGESPLHPHVFRAWGDGADPGVGVGDGAHVDFTSNVVVIGFRAGLGRSYHNVLLADFTRDSTRRGYTHSSDAQGSGGLSYYRCCMHHASKVPPNAGGAWAEHLNRTSGIYISEMAGLLFEKCFPWHNGWEDGYGQNREDNLGLPPSGYNHDLYLSENNYDTMIVDTLMMEGASTSVQFRSGGWVLNSMGVAPDIHTSGGGAQADATNSNRGQWTAKWRYVGTDAGYHEYTRDHQAAIGRGIDLGYNALSVLDTLMIHKGNPDDPAQVAHRAGGEYAYNSKLLTGREFNGVAYKFGSTNINVDGLDTAELDTASIQRYAESLTGVPTSIKQFGEYMLTLTPQERADVIAEGMEYFLETIEPKLRGNVADPYRPRAAPVHQVFNAHPGTEGFLWIHPLHWSEQWTPGQHPGDTADLNGNDVKFVLHTRTIAGLEFGGGRLRVSSGKLTVSEHEDAADVLVHNCGQYVAALGSGNYVLRDSGRLVLPEGVEDVSVEASGQSQLILPRAATLNRLHITGGMGWVGWDVADGTAELEITDELIFEFTPVLTVSSWATSPRALRLGKPEGQTSGFKGEFDSHRRYGTNKCDLRIRAASGTPVVGENMTREHVLPKMAAKWGAVEAIKPAEIGKIELFRSGRFGLSNPGVTATVVLPAGLDLTIRGAQYASPGSYDLTGPGITVTDQGATLPAGVTVTGGKLVLVVA